MMKSSSKQDSPGKKYTRSRSLCLSCILAYGHLCFAVPFVERDWVKVYEERVYAGSHEPYTIRAVVECSRYQYSGGRRVPMGTEVGSRR